LLIAWDDTAGAAPAVVGTAHSDRAQYRVDLLDPVGHEPGLVSGAAVHPRAAVPGIGAEQLPQQLRT
jgi:hypothetical protein